MKLPPTDTPLFQALLAAAEASQSAIPQAMRAEVMRRDRSTCHYCGGHATEVDHVRPRAQAGPTVPWNLVAACQHCNRSKGDRTPIEWQLAKQRRAAAQRVALRNRAVKVQKRPVVRLKRAPGPPPPQRSYLADLLRDGQSSRRRP